MIVGHIGAGASAPDTGDIQKSLRFASSRSTYLSKTFDIAGNRTSWCWFAAVKRGSLGTEQTLFGANPAGQGEFLRFTATGLLALGANGVTTTSTDFFRDPGAFLFVFWRYTGTAHQIYVNGQLVLQHTTTYSTNVNNNILHAIGRHSASALSLFDGYLSRVCFVDGGGALTHNDFTYFNTEINEWVTKSQLAIKAVVDAGGANSFMLDFDDGTSLTTLGHDKSTKGNNWTLNNFSLTAGVNYDWMEDVPGNSFAVLNPLVTGAVGATMSEGNLRATFSASVSRTIPVSSNRGKWYCEFTPTTGGDCWIGLDGLYRSNGQRYNGAAFVAYGATYTANDVLGCALDADAGTVEFFKNGVSQGVTPSLPSVGYITTNVYGNGGGISIVSNFGQRPFAYTPPTGYKAICQQNLPEPAIKNPENHFDVVLATGANIKSTTETLFSGNLLEWIKDRGNTNNHQLIDVVRGLTAVLQSNTTAAETTYSAPAGSSVGWAWKAGGAAVANTDGSITSQVSANTTAGFSIVTYTGTGANATVGHGLGVAPKMVIVKQRNGIAANWIIWQTALTGTEFLQFDTNAKQTAANVWNSTVPTSVSFNLGTNIAVNTNSNTYVAYCFAEIPGFSRIGSYVGNGSADGPFVYCGFKPKFVMIKRVDATGNWTIQDTSRSPINASNSVLYPHLTNVETVSNVMDITSTGFKLRNTTTENNGGGATYIFIAFADVPAQFANAR